MIYTFRYLLHTITHSHLINFNTENSLRIVNALFIIYIYHVNKSAIPRFNKMLANVSKPIPHNGQLLALVMQQRMMTVPKLARKMSIASNGIRQYCKLPSLHAALLWKLGEILEYDFFAALSKEFPLRGVSEKELELQQQLTDLKKENELYQKILAGRLGQ
ncbi:MAG: hypothetical protein ABI685_03460 [Ferruginibacter sp.]